MQFIVKYKTNLHKIINYSMVDEKIHSDVKAYNSKTKLL